MNLRGTKSSFADAVVTSKLISSPHLLGEPLEPDLEEID